MEWIEDQIFEKNDKRGGHYGQKKLLPCEKEFICFACGHNVIKKRTQWIFKEKMIFYRD